VRVGLAGRRWQETTQWWEALIEVGRGEGEVERETPRSLLDFDSLRRPVEPAY